MQIVFFNCHFPYPLRSSRVREWCSNGLPCHVSRHRHKVVELNSVPNLRVLRCHHEQWVYDVNQNSESSPSRNSYHPYKRRTEGLAAAQEIGVKQRTRQRLLSLALRTLDTGPERPCEQASRIVAADALTAPLSSLSEATFVGTRSCAESKWRRRWTECREHRSTAPVHPARSKWSMRLRAGRHQCL